MNCCWFLGTSKNEKWIPHTIYGVGTLFNTLRVVFEKNTEFINLTQAQQENKKPLILSRVANTATENRCLGLFFALGRYVRGQPRRKWGSD
jgi:hypothetical protein